MSGAFDRKLAAIFTAMDAYNYKAALKLTDAALKKYSKQQQLRALRAFALHQCGRGEEAMATLTALTAEGPDSEQVLHLMWCTYRSTRRPADAIPAYAAAAEKHPGDVDIWVALFGAYAKNHSFMKQQQVALKLCKLAPAQADTFGWWAACSAALQARAALRADPSTKLGQLAATLASRQAARGIPSYEALLLYMDILQGQGSFTTAVQVLTSAPPAAAGMPGDTAQLLAAAHTRGGELHRAAAIYLQAALDNPADWISWSLYLDCVLPGSVAPPTPGMSRFPVGVVGGVADIWDQRHEAAAWRAATNAMDVAAVEAAVQTAGEAAQRVQAAAAAAPAPAASRGAALAPVELALRRLRLGQRNAEQQLAQAVAAAVPALVTYFSCAADLRSFLAVLRDDAICQQLAASVEQTAAEAAAKVGEGAAGPHADGEASARAASGAATKRLQCQVNVHCVLHELDLPKLSGPEEAVTHAASLLKLYADHLHLSDGLDPKERGYGEELPAVAAAALATAARAAGPNDPAAAPLLLAATLVLEAAQVKRQVSAMLRLPSVAACSLLGAPHRAARHFSALDIKSILHDTMTGHWLVPTLLGAAADSELRHWLAGLQQLHVDQVVEASDPILTVYEHGTYSKAAEFVDFHERLKRSHTRALGEAEGVIAQLRTAALPAGKGLVNSADLCAAATKAAGEAGPALAPEALQQLRFNDDLSTRPAWFAPVPGASRFGISAWWESAAADGATPGYAHCWWSPVASAEQGSEAPEVWRSSLRAALQRRQQLPALLAAVLGAQPLMGDKLEALAQQLEQYSSAELQPADSQSAEALSNAALNTLFEAGLAVHSVASSLAAGDAAAADAVASACSQVQAAGEAFQQACSHAGALLAADQGGQPPLTLLPANGSFALAAGLVTEDVAWATACLQAWTRLAKTCAKTPEAASTAEPLVSAAAAAARGLGDGLAQIDGALLAAKEADTGACADAALAELQERWHGEELWGWEASFLPREALQELLEDQRDTAGRLHAAATRSLQSLKALAGAG